MAGCTLPPPAAKNEIKAIKYYTALVTPRSKTRTSRSVSNLFEGAQDPANLSFHGHFLTYRENASGLTHRSGREICRVIKTEEKGSDVNLATHLLYDAFGGSLKLPW